MGKTKFLNLEEKKLLEALSLGRTVSKFTVETLSRHYIQPMISAVVIMVTSWILM
jgi:hypothetical protein